MWLCLDISRYVLKECIHALRTLLTPVQTLFQTETEMKFLSHGCNYRNIYLAHCVGGGHVGGTPHGVTDHIFDFFLLKYPISSRIKNVVMFRHFKIYIKTL